MKQIIGLTGGIGSGKSTVARFFEQLGVPVYYADDAAKEVMQTPAMLEAVRLAFGDSIFDGNAMNRAKLAAIVFSDKAKLQMLNNLVHPAVKEHFKQWLKQFPDAPFVIREAAILFESGSYEDCDNIITVTAPFETKIDRVMMRDGASRHEVVARMQNQWADERKAALSDFVIENVDMESTREQVEKIFKTLKKI